MRKNCFLCILMICFLVSCNKNPQSVEQNVNEQQEETVKEKDTLDIIFQTEDFLSTIFVDAPYNPKAVTSQGLKIIIKNETKNPREIVLNEITINRNNMLALSVLKEEQDKLYHLANIGNLVIVPNSEETIWIKPFFLINNVLTEQKLKFQLAITFSVRNMKTNKMMYYDIIIDESGKKLYEKVELENGKLSKSGY